MKLYYKKDKNLWKLKFKYIKLHIKKPLTNFPGIFLACTRYLGVTKLLLATYSGRLMALSTAMLIESPLLSCWNVSGTSSEYLKQYWDGRFVFNVRLYRVLSTLSNGIWMKINIHINVKQICFNKHLRFEPRFSCWVLNVIS